MKITTLLFFAFFATSALFAQDPQSRQQTHDERVASDSKSQTLQLLEEKNARLLEAISDADAESARIMKEEVLQVMEEKTVAGMLWLARNPDESAQQAFDRMKAIMDALAKLSLDTLGTEKAREANSLVSEFLALMGRAPF